METNNHRVPVSGINSIPVEEASTSRLRVPDINAAPAGEASTSRRRAKPCIVAGCTTLRRGSNGLCIRHGGGKRCETCGKSAVGRTSFCRIHGGGLRCREPFCKRFVPTWGLFCENHVGDRCMSAGCPNKPVLSLYCLNHGAGRKCDHPDCAEKTAGRSRFCDYHQSHCHHPGCTKYQQGGTRMCGVHRRLHAAARRVEVAAVVAVERRRCEWGQLVRQYRRQEVGPCRNYAEEDTRLCARHGRKLFGREPRGDVGSEARLVVAPVEVIELSSDTSSGGGKGIDENECAETRLYIDGGESSTRPSNQRLLTSGVDSHERL